ncbi:putative ERCC4 domain, restriction endonuclease type II [Plasmopara halstedii]
MQYEGTSVKLRTCLASLTGTHEVIKRSGLGFYYLTERGRRSAELCPGSMMEAVTTADTGTIPRNNSTSTKSNTVCNTDTTLTEEVRQRPSDLSWTDVTPIDGESLSELTACPIGQAETLNTPFLEELIRQTDIWELVIVLDHREIIERRNPRILERKLQERNINCEVRALGVGDVQYIARRRRIGGETQEFMLNVIVERKEVHDLSGSIIDRRFYEQKTRLATVRKNCGNVHVIYLIEGSLTQITTVRTSGLNTAMARTQMQNNFFVQQSQNSDETVAFLARVYSRLLSRFPPTLEVMRPVTSQLLPSNHFDTNDFAKIFCLPPQTFAPFNSQFGKKTQFSVREIYQRMLLQVPGFSAAKTIELTAKYQNLKELETALRKRDRDSEVEHVRYGKCQRRLGTRVRTTLSHIFTSNEYTEDI